MNPQSAFGASIYKPVAPLSQCPVTKGSDSPVTMMAMEDGAGQAKSKDSTASGEEFIRSNEEVLEQAIKFLDQYYSSIKKSGSQVHKARIEEVAEQIRLTSTYHLLKAELIYGAKLAWRNTARCIGRIQWNKLQVFDARLTTTAQEMFEAICGHIRYATNKGNIRSAITIFPRRVKSAKYDYRVWNNQLIAYAGYQVLIDDDADDADDTNDSDDDNSNSDSQNSSGTKRTKVIGDPANVELTQLCEKLGWRGARTRFDILPLVLSASGGLPQVFPLPEDIVLRVKLHHPQFDWFSELQLEWYALPAVSNMMLDVGGLQFPAAPFNGWYMGTEIGTRDLCDASRYNILEEVARRMEVNTSSNLNLWKDKALVEVNTAVLYSFQQANVTIVDHHTASETFMTHMRNEQKLRGGCPADWVWIVPPTGASTTEVFHQEMINYHLLPNYEYQEPAWRTFDWSAALAGASQYSQQELEHVSGTIDLMALADAYRQHENMRMRQAMNHLRRYHHLRDVAIAVRFSCRLYLKSMARRIKCSIVFATETGKSEKYANKLEQLFSKTFNVTLQPMNEWSWQAGLQATQLLLVVASTFGNGEPPENGESFAKSLKSLIKKREIAAAAAATTMSNKEEDDNDSVIDDDNQQQQQQQQLQDEKMWWPDGRDIIKTEHGHDTTGDCCCLIDRTMAPNEATKVDSSGCSSSSSATLLLESIKSIKYGVFALGSTSYPNFCAFGKSVDSWLDQLGAIKMLDCECGDEMSGQEKKFDQWTSRMYRQACETFKIACDSMDWMDKTEERKWSPTDVKFIPLAIGPVLNQADREATCLSDLINLTSNKRITTFTLNKRNNCSSDHRTISVELTTTSAGGNNDCSQLQSRHLYEPGDHVAVYPLNSKELVDGILDRMKRDDNQMDPDQVFKILIKRRGDSSNSPSATSNNISNGKSALLSNRSVIDEIFSVSNGRMQKKHSIVSGTSGYVSEGFAKGENFSDGGSIILDSVSVITSNADQLDQQLDINNGSSSTNNNNNSSSNNNNSSIISGSIQTGSGSINWPLLSSSSQGPSSVVGNGSVSTTTASTSGHYTWVPHDSLPSTSLREALRRYLDISSGPSQDFLAILSQCAQDGKDKKRLMKLATQSSQYEQWKLNNCPNLLHVLNEFKSIKFKATLLTQLPLIQPRFYSISSSPLIRAASDSDTNEQQTITLTLGLVNYTTKSGQIRRGLCSNYLNNVDLGDTIFAYVRSASSFHMPPATVAAPLILVAAGTGLAPFRSFWEHKSRLSCNSNEIYLYFGCRNPESLLYQEEINSMIERNIINGFYVAYSRQVVGGKQKQYVQHKLEENKLVIRQQIMELGAHVYVCGDVAMAEAVHKTLNNILSVSSADNNNQADGDKLINDLREQNRYHEDIFGAKTMVMARSP